MKFIYLLALLLSASLAFAQQDSLREDKGYIHRLREKLNHVEQTLDPATHVKKDTLKAPGQQKADSLKTATSHKVDSLKAFAGTNNLHQDADSLQSALTSPADKITNNVNAVQGKLAHKTDSTAFRVTALENKLTTMPQGIQNKSDSLQNRVNGIAKKGERIESQVQNKADSLQRKAMAGITSAEHKMEDKISQVTGEKINVPTDKVKLPSGANEPNRTLPGVDNTSLKVPGVDLPNTTIPTLQDKIPELNTSGITTTLPKTGTVPDLKTTMSNVNLPKTDELAKIKDVSGEITSLDGKLANAEKYEGEVAKLKAGDTGQLEKTAEDNVKNIAQVKGFNTEITKAQQLQARQEALLQKYRDEKLVEQELKRKATNVANDYMAEHMPEINSAQAKLSESKKGLMSAKKLKEVFKQRSEELTGKKFYQRLVPGITTQVYHIENIVSTDLALQLGYRFLPRLTAGVGGLYRIGIDDKFDYYVRGLGVYGGRLYVDFVAYKGIFAHGEIEALKLNASRMVLPVNQETVASHVYGSYFGLGKKINVSRKIKGSIMGLYRVEYTGTLPSMNKLSMRIGFDYCFEGKRHQFVIR